MSLQASRVTSITLLGQCTARGYDGFQGLTYPKLLRRMFQQQNLNVKLCVRPLYHPRSLQAWARSFAAYTQPDIVVISLPAIFCATASRVFLFELLAPDVMIAARTFAHRLEDSVPDSQRLGMLRHLMPSVILPPVKLDEYRRWVEEGIRVLLRWSSSRVVLQGPGPFNDDCVQKIQLYSPQIWKDVNRMVRDLAKQFQLPLVDGQGALSGMGSEVFTPGHHLLSQYGHQMLAREMHHVLVSQMAGMSQLPIAA